MDIVVANHTIQVHDRPWVMALPIDKSTPPIFKDQEYCGDVLPHPALPNALFVLTQLFCFTLPKVESGSAEMT